MGTVPGKPIRWWSLGVFGKHSHWDDPEDILCVEQWGRHRSYPWGFGGWCGTWGIKKQRLIQCSKCYIRDTHKVYRTGSQKKPWRLIVKDTYYVLPSKKPLQAEQEFIQRCRDEKCTSCCVNHRFWWAERKGQAEPGGARSKAGQVIRSGPD